MQSGADDDEHLSSLIYDNLEVDLAPHAKPTEVVHNLEVAIASRAEPAEASVPIDIDPQEVPKPQAFGQSTSTSRVDKVVKFRIPRIQKQAVNVAANNRPALKGNQQHKIRQQGIYHQSFKPTRSRGQQVSPPPSIFQRSATNTVDRHPSTSSRAVLPIEEPSSRSPGRLLH